MKKYILLLFLPFITTGTSSPTVCVTPKTCYKGSWAYTDSNSNIKYASFQGIKYAEAPTGSLRFRAPKQYQAGEGVIDVSAESKVVCPQLKHNGGMTGQEDCLLLNIYVPENALVNTERNLPVMVWIYGGSFLTGSNRVDEYGPNQFMDKNVVIVTINYRLGPLGFLSMGTNNVPGNAGLKDQAMAITWVKRFITKFSGDPDSVTLFGESAGAHSIGLHIISPLSKGIFRRAILQSSSAIDPAWRSNNLDEAMKYADTFSRALKCDEENDVLRCLQARDIADIMALTYLNEGIPPGSIYSIWMPVSEGNGTLSPFLSGNPKQLMETGQFNTEVEVIIGTNKDEGILTVIDLLVDTSQWDKFRENFDKTGAKYLFDINLSDMTEKDIQHTHSIVNYYVGSKDNITADNMQNMIDMFTDAMTLYGTYTTINHLLNYGVKVYEYRLAYRGTFSLTQYYGVDPVGVCHADDLNYLWDPSFLSPLGPLSEEDKAVRETMTTAWANFAIYGDPTPTGSSLSWTPVANGSLHNFWNISGPSPVMATSQKIQERMAIWDQVVG